MNIDAVQLSNTEFEGKNNAYLLRGSETALIDTGVSLPRTEEALRKGLADHGVKVADLDHILLTHLHEDHIGLAGSFQQESGAVVHAHPIDAPLISREPEAVDQFREQQRAFFNSWGMPTTAQRELLDFMDHHDELRGEPPTPITHTDGDIITLGDQQLTVVHMPGHTAGHIGFTFETDNGTALFAGDSLLPHYTPNVGGADVRVSDPLESYLTTLYRIRDSGYIRAYPGHRYVIDDPTARAQEIINHHYERSQRIIDILSENSAMDAWTVSAELFGDLEGIHILHGPGEAYAHLNHLTNNNLLTEKEGTYTTKPNAAAHLDDLFDTAEL
ncbi:MBL fold metallo-hydrolase [Haladaptatus caseinilyticus]|uniref:MBL fold metallo-hydrolase n=1 Tax=Haladaptatus caseinilyticus TaxID=2993314 RepID=UPI00224B11C8|nr:MBL fold metallo-hydrolase [Haladaptatus caseinilyticus]